MKCIKSHTGYSSCDKCTEVGEYVKGRVVFSGIDAPKRTDETFVLQNDEEHHLSETPLLQLSVGLVSVFPIDYMRNVCLGIMRKLLNTWLSGNLQVRLCNRSVKLLSEKLLRLRKYIPTEINRKCRSLDELSHWKASEFRTFLLYVGPVVLSNNNIDFAIFEHFLLLHCGITILISAEHIANLGYDLPSQILRTFVLHCKTLYKLEFMVYNIHVLSHIVDDVKVYGPLDFFSAFPFEYFLGQIKRLVRSPNKPLPQIY